MELIAIHPHALKHGLTETDITCAWNSAFAWFRRDLENGGIDYVLVGLDGRSRLMELIARYCSKSRWLYHLPRPCPSYAQGAQGNRDRSIGGAMDAKQLEKMIGFAPGELEKAAEAYEKDEWPKGRTIKLGRPPISDEPSVVLSARVGESVLEAFDAKAKRHGQTRTERLRELITLDAMIA